MLSAFRVVEGEAPAAQPCYDYRLLSRFVPAKRPDGPGPGCSSARRRSSTPMCGKRSHSFANRLKFRVRWLFTAGGRVLSSTGMTDQNVTETEQQPAATMLELLGGFVVSQAVFAVAELGAANVLLDGPRTVHDIAAAVGADADSLRRIIRLLVQHGVFRTSGDIVELTDLGRTLADGPIDSVRKLACYFRRTHYAAFGSLLEAVRTGQPAATLFLGRPFFEWINENPELAALQNETMAGFTQNSRGDLLDRYDLPGGATVADIGGADGTLLVELLACRPARRGIVYDLPSSVAA